MVRAEPDATVVEGGQHARDEADSLRAGYALEPGVALPNPVEEPGVVGPPRSMSTRLTENRGLDAVAMTVMR